METVYVGTIIVLGLGMGGLIILIRGPLNEVFKRTEETSRQFPGEKFVTIEPEEKYNEHGGAPFEE